MVNSLIKRELHKMDIKKQALENINPLLNKLTNAVKKYSNEELGYEPDGNMIWDSVVPKYVEVDIWHWCTMIVLNVLPSENKKLFDAFKKVFAKYDVKEYKKENDADSKKRKLRASFIMSQYKGFGVDNVFDYRVDIIFRGNLPETCRLEYEEHYEVVESDTFIVKNGKVMQKEVTVKVICDEPSMLKLPEATA